MGTQGRSMRNEERKPRKGREDRMGCNESMEAQRIGAEEGKDDDAKAARMRVTAKASRNSDTGSKNIKRNKERRPESKRKKRCRYMAQGGRDKARRRLTVTGKRKRETLLAQTENQNGIRENIQRRCLNSQAEKDGRVAETEKRPELAALRV